MDSDLDADVGASLVCWLRRQQYESEVKVRQEMTGSDWSVLNTHLIASPTLCIFTSIQYVLKWFPPLHLVAGRQSMDVLLTIVIEDIGEICSSVPSNNSFQRIICPLQKPIHRLACSLFGGSLILCTLSYHPYLEVRLEAVESAWVTYLYQAEHGFWLGLHFQR